MLEEQLAILDGLWNQPDGWSFEGRFYRVEDAHFRPKPDQRINVIVGGEGSPRSLRIAAAHAGEFNLSSSSPERAVDRFAKLDETCRAAGRDPSTIRRSVMAGVLVGSDDKELAERADRLMKLLGADEEGVGGRAPAGTDASAWLDHRRPRWVMGTPDEARAMVARYEAAGCERLILQDFIPWDLEMVDLLGREIVGRA